MEGYAIKVDGRTVMEGDVIQKVVNEIIKTIKEELPEENQTLENINYIMEKAKNEIKAKELKL